MSKEIDITKELDCKDILESAKIVPTNAGIEIRFKYLPTMSEEDKDLYEACIMSSFIKNMIEGSKLGINEISIKREISKYKEVSNKEAEKIICTREPLGKFWTKDKDGYVAIDNSTGDAWTEDFRTKEECMAYLEY